MTAQLQQKPPYRAEQLGSLLRSDKLLEIRHGWVNSKTSVDELHAIEDADIKEIVKIQHDLGFHAVTDGEYRRHMFWGEFWPSLDGMTKITDFSTDIFRPYVPDIAAFLESNHIPGETVICTGKIKHVGSTYTREFDYLKSLVPKEEWGSLKLTLAAPTWYHLRYREGLAYPKDVYANDDEYFADIVTAYQEELRILYEHGCRNVQIDDPSLSFFCSEKMLAGWKADPDNRYGADDLFDRYVKLHNECISKAPADMHIGVHICRGNFVNSRHFLEGAYDRIAVRLFQELNFHTYYLEYDTDRAGGFEPLQYLPKNRNVILGVITSKFGDMENIDKMEARVREAVKWMRKGSGESDQEALNRIGVSAQCGFASHSDGNSISREDMFAKLKLVRELADRIWGGEP